MKTIDCGGRIMSDKKVYFIRHKGYTKDEIEDLKYAKRIAIFFDDVPFDQVVENIDYSVDEIEYNEEYFKEHPNSTYKSALKYMWTLGKNGGLVVAEYNSEDKCYIGEVKKGTEIVNFEEKFKGKFNVTIQLSDVKTIEYADYPVLPAVRPIQGTICNPHAPFFTDVIPAIYNNDFSNIKIRRSLLHYKMLEQLCVEYLREKKGLKYCILRPGISLAKIDIAGVSNDGELMYAQVKADHITQARHDEFKKFVNKKIGGEDKEEVMSYIFCEKANDVKNKSININYIDVDVVFDHFYKKDQDMIKRMIGFAGKIL